jgi:hypothetical protein
VRKSTDPENLAALEEVAPCNVGTCSDTPTIIVRHGSAGNDPAISEDDAEPWTPHALTANGYGDLAITDAAASARPTSYELYHAARAHRASDVASAGIERPVFSADRYGWSWPILLKNSVSGPALKIAGPQGRRSS